MLPYYHSKKIPCLIPGRALLAAWLLAAVGQVSAGEVTATLVDQDGEPIDDAVMYLQSVDGQSLPYQPGTAAVDQVDKAFVPHVRVVTVNTAVEFPNSDDIRHHVYSFSDAKTFELPLYIGTPANPVVFDQPGVVDLGCNIHDFMRGYVLVLDTPHHARSEAGRVRLTNLPAGRLDIRIWHPRLAADAPLAEMIELTAGDASHELTMTLELRGGNNTRRAPKRRSRRY